MTSPSRFTNEFLLQEGDLLLARTGASVGKTYLYNKTDGKVYYAGYLIKFHIELNKPKFVFYELQNQRFIRWVNIMSKRSGQPGINAEEYSSYKLFLPCKEEQNKLIKFFDFLELKINILRSKIQVLKKYKEGLINNLLKPTVVNWKNNMKEGSKLSNFLVPYKQMALNNNVYNHATLSKEGVVPKCERYDRDFLVKDSNKQYRVTHLNDLIYNPANLKFGVICINKLGTVIVSPIYETFKIINIDQILLEAFLTSNTFINFSLKFEEGTVYERKAVSVEDFLNIKICVKNINSQKISLILKAIQTKNNILSDKLKVIKSLKSYLLSYMFI